MAVETKAGVTVTTNITVSLHDVDELRELYPGWDTLDKKEKMRLTQEVEPVWETKESNTATNLLLNVLIDNLLDSPERQTASFLALGTGETQPIKTNVALNNEVYRVGITEASRNGNSLETTTFIDSNEANGNLIVEVGLFTGDDSDTEARLLNHSLITELNKISARTATFAVDLVFAVA